MESDFGNASVKARCALSVSSQLWRVPISCASPRAHLWPGTTDVDVIAEIATFAEYIAFSQ